ncbi:MAG TPA: hypothetical protein VFO84_02755 [Dehalococcoidia bacterium]|nr:hypothetical protein [Dehalococcoidia bacterium]
MTSGDHWRPAATTSSSLKPLIALLGGAAVLFLAALALGFTSDSAEAPPLQQNYPFVIGLQQGWCSTPFLEPVWGDRVDDAASVCDCESGGVPTVVSDGVPYYGLFQIDPAVHGLDPDALLDPVYNSWIAAALQGRDGWEPWPVCAENLIPA